MPLTRSFYLDTFMKNKFLHFLFPSEKCIESLEVIKRDQVPYLIYINFIFIIMFVTMGILLMIGQFGITGPVFIAASVIFLPPIILMKKDKIYASSISFTLALCIICAVVLFVTPLYNSNLSAYRNVLFIVVLACVNLIVSIQKMQVLLYAVITFVIWTISLFTKMTPLIPDSPSSFIVNMSINSLALLMADWALVFFNGYNHKMIARSVKQEEETKESLEKITRIFEESKTGLNIGNKLTLSAESARSSLDTINKLYDFLAEETRNLKEHADSANESGQKVAQEAELMRSSVNEQSASISSTSTSMAEIADGLTNITSIANEQQQGITRTVKNLDNQKVLLGKLLNQMELLKTSSENISHFVGTINSISAQTGLLAMNASIEAAHAGEKGKGFAVISHEIRKLSDETTKSASKIEESLSENAKIVDETSAFVKEFVDVNEMSSGELKETMNAIEKIISGIGEIDEGTRSVNMSLQDIVDLSNNSTSKVENVTLEVGNQKTALAQIMDFSTSLLSRTSELEKMLYQIKDAINTIELQAEENHDVSQKINSAFGLE